MKEKIERMIFVFFAIFGVSFAFFLSYLSMKNRVDVNHRFAKNQIVRHKLGDKVLIKEVFIGELYYKIVIKTENGLQEIVVNEEQLEPLE
jgi:hypothetical protein